MEEALTKAPLRTAKMGFNFDKNIIPTDESDLQLEDVVKLVNAEFDRSIKQINNGPMIDSVGGREIRNFDSLNKKLKAIDNTTTEQNIIDRFEEFNLPVNALLGKKGAITQFLLDNEFQLEENEELTLENVINKLRSKQVPSPQIHMDQGRSDLTVEECKVNQAKFIKNLNTLLGGWGEITVANCGFFKDGGVIAVVREEDGDNFALYFNPIEIEQATKNTPLNSNVLNESIE